MIKTIVIEWLVKTGVCILLMATLTSCFFENKNYKITMPTNGTYVGTSTTLPPVSGGTVSLPDQIVISYEGNITVISVFLNGSPIGEFANLSAGVARINIVDVEHFLIQGENEILVEPMAFGPRSIFKFDNKGPEVVITSAATQVDGSITVSGYLSDSSRVETLVLENRPYAFNGEQGDTTIVHDSDGTPPVTDNAVQPIPMPAEYLNLESNPRGISDDTAGATSTASINFSGDNQFVINIDRQARQNDHYRFLTTDQYGYRHSVEYLADGQMINPLFKVRVGSSFLEEIKPLANAQGDNIYFYDKAGMALRGKVSGAHSIQEAEEWLSPNCSDQYTEAEWLALTLEERVATGCAASNNDIFKSIRENHSAIYTELGAAHNNASECHETPQTFVCHNAVYLNNNAPNLTDGGDAWSARGADKDKWWDSWVCTDWTFVPSPDSGSGAKNGNVGRECSYIEMYTLQSEDVTVNTLTMDHQNNSELKLSATVSDSHGSAQPGESRPFGMTTTLGIFNWQCGPKDWPHGTYSISPLCDGQTTAGCTKTFGVRLGNRDESAALADVLAGVTSADWCQKGDAVNAAVDLGDITVQDDGVTPAGNIRALIDKGNLDVRLNNFKFNFNDPVISVGLDVGFLAGMLEDIFVDITESVIRNSLNDFDLEFLFTSEDERKTAFSMGLQAWEVNSVCIDQGDLNQYYCGSQPNVAASPWSGDINWEMMYRGKVKTEVADSAANEVLGSLYSDGELSRPLDAAGSKDNLSLAINSNIINQMFLAFYNTGMTHIGMLLHEPTIPYFGPNATDTLGNVDDYRVIMNPKSPPTIRFRPGVGTDVEATIAYTGAALEIDKKTTVTWENSLLVDLDIEIGVTLVEKDQVVVLDFLGAPKVEVNNVRVPSNMAGADAFLEVVLEKITQFLMPRIVTEGLSIDLRNLQILDFPPRPATQADVTAGTISQAEFDAGGAMIKQKLQLSSQGIRANGGDHLDFAMGMNKVDNGKQP